MNPGMKDFELVRFDPERDAELLHAWISEERAQFWGMLGQSVEQVRETYREIGGSPSHHAFWGLRNGRPAFLMERYDPAHDVVGDCYPVQRGDVGMHFLVAPPEGARQSGFTAAVLRFIMAELFADPQVQRVVVEPDLRNAKVQALNAKVGFVKHSVVSLPDKDAWLSFCRRQDFLDRGPGEPQPAADWLAPDRWRSANRHLVRKAIAEFSHERILHPVAVAGGYELSAPSGERYRFSARRMRLEHWALAEPSIQRFGSDGAPKAVDALEFITDFHAVLGIDPVQLPVYLEEISSTLSSHAFKQLHSTASAEELARGDGIAAFQAIERSMTEGHPCFVANNGRLGFGRADFLAFAPESGAGIRLVWVAVARNRAVFSSIEGLDYQALLTQEFDPEMLAEFGSRLAVQGLDAQQFFLMPVHPWQWEHKLQVTFAAEIAQQRIVYLGRTPDEYQAQQSIRTFFNRTRPHRAYVKTALSVLNMGFMRGLSPEYMAATPAINDWLHALVAADPVLEARGLVILREVAAIGYHNHYFEAAAPKGSAYRTMFSALWRESPVPHLAEGETLATMASLLHVDAAGKSLIGAYIERSGVLPEIWLAKYLRAYLQPLVHCLMKYELAFMPHGENVILVLREGFPVRVIMKDLAEEIVLMGERVAVPEAASRIKLDIPEKERVLAIFTDVFDCVFRFLAEVLETEGLIDEAEFWALVAQSIEEYRAEVLGSGPEPADPALAEAFATHDLFAAEFDFSCLNRLQLRNNQQMLDLADPSGGLQFSGRLLNPIAR